MNCSPVLYSQFARLFTWKRSLAILACSLGLALTLGANTAYGQEPNDPEAEFIAANAQLRQFAAIEMVEASNLFFNSIPLQLDNIVVLSRNDALVVGANVAGVKNLELNDLQDGANIGLIFFGPNRPNPFVSPGIYLVKAYLGRSRGHNHNEDSRSSFGRNDDHWIWARKGRVELIDKTGNVAATLPLTVVTGSGVTATTLPLQTVNLQDDLLALSVRWNTSSNRSLNLFYTIPLIAPRHQR